MTKYAPKINATQMWNPKAKKTRYLNTPYLHTYAFKPEAVRLFLFPGRLRRGLRFGALAAGRALLGGGAVGVSERRQKRY